MKDEEQISRYSMMVHSRRELIEVCPICGCAELYYEAGGIEGLYHCKHCGYIGAFVIDANKEMMELIQKNMMLLPGMQNKIIKIKKIC